MDMPLLARFMRLTLQAYYLICYLRSRKFAEQIVGTCELLLSSSTSLLNYSQSSGFPACIDFTDSWYSACITH